MLMFSNCNPDTLHPWIHSQYLPWQLSQSGNNEWHALCGYRITHVVTHVIFPLCLHDLVIFNCLEFQEVDMAARLIPSKANHLAVLHSVRFSWLNVMISNVQPQNGQAWSSPAHRAIIIPFDIISGEIWKNTTNWGNRWHSWKIIEA